jgi:hypothetical protein
MQIPIPKSILIALGLVLALVPAYATSNHEYAKDEYAVIRNGLAPNKQLSLASHGGGELGDDDLHVWLMAEPAHNKIVALQAIGSDNNLDTDPDAYHATWSADSRHVAVAFRSDRHEVDINLYSVDARGTHPIAGPNLFKEVTSRDVADSDDLRQRIFAVDWRGATHFTLREYRTVVVSDSSLLKLLGTYGRLLEKMPDGKLFVGFSAEADCVILPDGRSRVVDLRPGKAFGDAVDWWYTR